MSLRLALIKYLKKMQPGPPVAIFERDTKMRLVQGFTSDPQVLLAAAESERDKPAMPNVIRATREEYLEYRLDEVSLGFQLLGRYLAAFPGRKNLIWFTGALPQSNILTPMGDPFNDDFKILEGDPHDLTAALTLSRVAVYPIDSRGLQAAPQYTAAAKGPPAANAPVQFETGQAFQHLALDSIAESTGGRAYYNSNGLGAKITEIEENGSSYYTLTYATTQQNVEWRVPAHQGWRGPAECESAVPAGLLRGRSDEAGKGRTRRDREDTADGGCTGWRDGTEPGHSGDDSA